MARRATSPLETITRTVEVVTVIVAAVISIVSFNATRRDVADARRREAAAPFLQLRQSLYLEAVKAAAVLTNPDVHTKEEMDAARKRFRELYVAELSMVEPTEVEAEMVALAKAIDPSLVPLDPTQRAAYDLSHALRNSFVESWGLNEMK